MFLQIDSAMSKRRMPVLAQEVIVQFRADSFVVYVYMLSNLFPEAVSTRTRLSSR